MAGYRPTLPEKQPVPPGILALKEAGMTIMQLARIWKIKGTVSVRRKLAGGGLIYVSDLELLADFLGVKPGDLWDPELPARVDMDKLRDPRFLPRDKQAKKKTVRRTSAAQTSFLPAADYGRIEAPATPAAAKVAGV